MGQAKRRGTFEERRIAAIWRDRVAKEEETRRRREREQAKTDVQKKSEAEAYMTLVQCIALANSYNYYR